MESWVQKEARGYLGKLGMQGSSIGCFSEQWMYMPSSVRNLSLSISDDLHCETL